MRTEVRLVSGGKVLRLWLPASWDAVRFNGETYRLLRHLGSARLKARVGVRVVRR
jgi:hypothetical protein